MFAKKTFKMKYNLDPNQILLLAQGESVEVNGQKVQLAVVEEVTNQPPVKSLKHEDCMSRVRPLWYIGTTGEIYIGTTGEIYETNTVFNFTKNQVPTQRNAKQVLAFCQLLTIMHDANDGEWRPKKSERAYNVNYDRCNQVFFIDYWELRTTDQIYFKELAKTEQALEENRQLFLDFFGIEEVANG